MAGCLNRHLPFFGSFGISKSTTCKLILQTKWPHETSYKNEAYIVTLGAPLNGSSFKRVYCTHFFCYSRNVSLCESLWLSYFENITIFWSFHRFRNFVIIMISLYPTPIPYSLAKTTWISFGMPVSLWPLRSKTSRWVRLDESTKRYAIASRLHIYWWIFMGNTPKEMLSRDAMA